MKSPSANTPTVPAQSAGQVNINIGKIQIDGMRKAPGNAVSFAQHIEAALQGALAESGIPASGVINIPQLIVNLPYNAGEPQIIAALIQAIKHQAGNSRRGAI